MKAIRFHEYGGTDVLVYEEAERPVPGGGQVLVKVAGTSFNEVDAAIRAGYLQEVLAATLPLVPGIDVAGTIAEFGERVDGWSVGDGVVASLPLGGGAAAEYALVPAEILAAAPKTVALADAAVLPAVGLTAWQALFEHAALEAGQRILVNGAGGGVGGYAVQLARRAGAEVTATASARSADRLRDYGADRLIDYSATPVSETAERFDVVLNLVRTSPDETAALVRLVADGGVLVSTTTPAPEDVARRVRTVSMFLRSDAGELAHLVALVDAGELRLHVAQRRRLADLGAVHEEFAAGRLAGKTVIAVEARQPREESA